MRNSAKHGPLGCAFFQIENLILIPNFRGVLKHKIYPDPDNMQKFCLPLEVFDNTEWDERTSSEWALFTPLPCRVLLETGNWADGAALGLVEGRDWQIYHFLEK